MGVSGGPKSVADGLIFHIDPANKRSYPGTGTTIFDLSGNNYTSYFANGALLADDVVRVDGVDDYIATPIFNLTSPVTVSAWVKNVVNDSIVFGSYNGGVYANAEYIFHYVGKTLNIQGSPGGAKTFQAPDLKLNAWVHLTMTRDSSNDMRVFLNGVASSSNPQNYSVNLNLNQIGRYSNFYNQYNVKGSIGEVRIYNRALSSTEVLQYYNSSKYKYNVSENIVTDGLVLNLDPGNSNSYAGTGITIYDISGSGQTGTLTNGPAFSGLNGGSIVLDGTNDYILFNNAYASGFGISANATISIWAKINIKNQYTTFIGFYNPGQGNRCDFGMDVTNSNTIRLWKNDIQADTYGSVTNNKWVNYVITSDNLTAKFYRDCVLLYTGNVSGSINNNRMFAISYSWDMQVDASISQTLLYNKTLTQQEVLQNYNATKNRYIKVLPPISDALVLNLDAGARASYVGVGNSWNDISGSGYVLTLRNSPTFVASGESSYFTLNGSNQDFYLASYGPTFTSVTFNLWVWRNGTQNGFAGLVISRGNASGFFYTNQAGSPLTYMWLGDGNTYNYSSGLDTANQTWSMATLTLTPTDVKWYINGVLQHTRVNGHTSSTFSNLYIGSDGGLGGRYYNGRLAQVQIYNRALTAAEVLQNFNAYRTRYGI